MNIETILLAALGGVVGSAITAMATFRIYTQQERARAYEYLWDYQYALLGYAIAVCPRDGSGETRLLSSDFDGVIKALRKAYPYARYIRKSQRDKFFKNAHVGLDIYSQDVNAYGESIYDEYSQLSEKLGKEIELAFPDSISRLVLQKIKYRIVKKVK